MESSNALVGTWKLVSFMLRLQDGTTRHPWGSEVAGQVIYGPDGFMAGSLMKRDRSPFEASDVMAGTPQEYEAAMTSYVGYTGPYSLQGNRVIHHAEVSLFPNWTGTDIERFFEVQGSKLTLSTPPLYLRWHARHCGACLGEARAAQRIGHLSSNPLIERPCPGKPGHASHLKRRPPRRRNNRYMNEKIVIRNETSADVSTITEVTIAAFKTLEISNNTEQFIIEALRAANALKVSLVAEADGCVIGHIAFSPVTISDGTQNWYGLGPVSVLPEYQRQGIGNAIIREGLSRLKEMNAQGCCLVGHPDYYRNFGFKNIPELVYDGVPHEFFFALSFDGQTPHGTVTFHDGFKADGQPGTCTESQGGAAVQE